MESPDPRHQAKGSFRYSYSCGYSALRASVSGRRPLLCPDLPETLSITNLQLKTRTIPTALKMIYKTKKQTGIDLRSFGRSAKACKAFFISLKHRSYNSSRLQDRIQPDLYFFQRNPTVARKGLFGYLHKAVACFFGASRFCVLAGASDHV